MCKGKVSCKECDGKAKKKPCKACTDYGKNWGKESVNSIGASSADFPVAETKGAMLGVGAGYLMSILGRKYPSSVVGDSLTRAGIQAGGGIATILFTDDKASKSFGVGLIGSSIIPLAEKAGITGVDSAVAGLKRVTNKITGFTRNLKAKSGGQRGAKVFIPKIAAGSGSGSSFLRRN